MKLFIVGQGIKSCKQFTFEAIEVLRAQNKTLFISIDSNQTENFLKEQGIDHLENIKDLYKDASRDEENYQRLLDKILLELKKNIHVGLVLPGNPRVGVTLLSWLENLSKENHFELNVIPGISSWDTIVNDLRVDPLERGVHVLDANRLLLFEYNLEPLTDCMLYHVCSVGTSFTYLTEASRDNKLFMLRDYLLKFYPQEHKVTLVSSSVGSESGPEFHTFNLSDLASKLNLIHFGSTLYVPGVKLKKVNREFLSFLQEGL